ncbi:MAG: hypothetical protein AAF215_20460 [Cyanobacteria bacterium P01_A01_bin.123]
MLFLLEFGCLTTIVLIFTISDFLPYATVDPTRKYLYENFIGRFFKLKYISSNACFIVFSLSAFPYAIFKILLGENPGIRLSYSLFVFFLSLFWLSLARDLLSRPTVNLLTTFNLLKSTPETIFSYGRGLFPTLNILAVSVSLLTLPMLFVLPTLPISQSTFQFNQRAVVALLGILLCLTLLVGYLFIQVIVSNAVNQSLLRMDQEIEINLYSYFGSESNRGSLGHIKVLVEAREALVKSISNPSGSTIISVINVSSILAILLGIVLK